MIIISFNIAFLKGNFI